MKRIILALVLVLALAIPCFGMGSLTINNCTPETWVGGVLFNADQTDYSQVDELELKSNGTLNIALEPGTYGITHYRPRKTFQQGNQIFVIPAAILDYVNVDVMDNEESILEFGCE